VPAIKDSPKLVEMISNKPYSYVWCLKVMKDAKFDGFIDLRTVNNTPTLSLCSSSSKEAKTKVDATPLKKPAYKLFQVSPGLVNF
jgi:hypothetical protein